MSLPLFKSTGMNVFTLTSDICSNTKLCLRTASVYDILQHPVVSVRRFDKKLSLMLGINALFQLLQLLGTF